MGAACAGVEDEVGAVAFFGVGHLGFEDGVEFFFVHVRAGENAGALDEERRGDDDGIIDAVLCPRFKKKGDIKADDFALFIGCVADKIDLAFADQGVKDFFEFYA